MQPFVEAVVQAGPFETRYRRAGQGPVVLLLLDPAADPAFSDRLFGRLVQDFRVFALRISEEMLGAGEDSTPSRLLCWLEGVMDGLGVERAALVLGPRVEALLSPSLRGCSEWIAAVALVPPHTSDLEPLVHVLQAR